LRIKKVTFCPDGERGVFISEIGGGEDMDRYRS